MTTLVTNSGSSVGGGGRSRHLKDNKKQIHHSNKSSSNSNVPSSVSNAIESATSNNNNQNSNEEFRNKSDKFQPTAEQMRIASLMSDKKDDDLKPKIDQIVELTGAKREDAAVALYDCDNDMTKAIEMILDGESLDSEWQSTGKKKKTKASTNQNDNVLTNGKQNEKSNRSSKNASNSLTTQSKGSRGGLAGGKNNRNKKDFRSGNDTTKQNDTEETDVFTANPDKKIGNSIPGGKRGGSRGRAPRGKGIARSRTFMNRGMQNNNGNNNDGFPNSIETWNNSAVEPSKPANDDLNTMKVGNWADVANEEWSEDDWNGMETKVFTPSTKVIPEKDEIKEQTSKSSNHINVEENSQPTISSIISSNIKKSPSAGQAFIQRIQQQSQNSNLNQYNMQFNSKHATESIKSLVGLSKNNMISNDHSLDNLSKTSQPTNQNRIKNQTMASKIPESAVEMPSNDGISNLSIHFGSIELGSNNFPLSSNDTSLFDSVGQSIAKKADNKNLSLLSTNSSTTETNYRTGDNSGNVTNKNLLQHQVLPSTLNDSILNNDHRSDKPTLSSSSYNASKPLERKSDYMGMSHSQYNKTNYQQQTENVYSSNYQQPQQQQPSTNVNYYTGQTHQQVAFGASQILPNNTYSNAYNASSVQKNLRDMDQSCVTGQVNSSSTVSTKSYDTSSNTGTSLSLMSSSTSTTNAIKNTSTSTGKGIHSVPPGVNNSVQPVLSTPYIQMGNAMPAMFYSYDMAFSNTARDHAFPPYAPDVKYNRNSESDMLPVSSQAAQQTSNQAPNPYFSHGAYGYYPFPNYMGNLYQTAPPLYTVPQAQNTATATNAFPKQSTAASYGSHSYSFDPMSTAAVPQTQDYVNTKTYQHKQLAAAQANAVGGDMSTNPQNMYSKVQTSMSKSYDKQGFQGQNPQMTQQHQQTNAAQSAQAYSNAYMLPPHAAATMQHSFQTNTDAQISGNTAAGTPVLGNQRTLSQAHKNIANASTAAAAGIAYGKFGWN